MGCWITIWDSEQSGNSEIRYMSGHSFGPICRECYFTKCCENAKQKQNEAAIVSWSTIITFWCVASHFVVWQLIGLKNITRGMLTFISNQWIRRSRGRQTTVWAILVCRLVVPAHRRFRRTVDQSPLSCAGVKVLTRLCTLFNRSTAVPGYSLSNSILVEAEKAFFKIEVRIDAIINFSRHTHYTQSMATFSWCWHHKCVQDNKTDRYCKARQKTSRTSNFETVNTLFWQEGHENCEQAAVLHVL
jgi:hypothetical protein